MAELTSKVARIACNPSSAVQNCVHVDHCHDNLAHRAAKGGLVTVGTQGIKFILQLLTTVIFARLLLPADFGVVAMVTVVTGFIYLFRDMGLTTAIIREKDLTREQLNFMFWINTLLGIILTGVGLSLSPLIAWFYDDKRLFSVMLVLSGTFALSSLGVEHTALLRREMRFGVLAVCEIISICAGLGVGVASIFVLDAGYWGLIWMQVTTEAVTLVGVWIACPWRPGKPKKAGGVRSMLGFGADVSLIQVICYASLNVDKVLLGRYWGATPLGFYNLAYRLLMLPFRQIEAPVAAVAIPALSRLQDHPDRYARYYYAGVTLLAWVLFPAVAFMAGLIHPLIVLVFGPKWVPAAFLFQILALGALVGPIMNSVIWVYLSLGRTRRFLVWQLLANPVVVAGSLIGLPWGAQGVAIGLTSSIVILTVPCVLFAFAGTPLSSTALLRACLRPAAVGGAAFLGIEAVELLLNSAGPGWRLIAGTGAGAACGLLALLLVPGARGEAMNLVRMRRFLKPGGI